MSNGVDRDDLIVNGYIRRQKTDIPLEIIELCLKWYHIALFWEFLENSRVEIMNDDHTKPTIIKYKQGRGYTSCYGSIVMPSMNNDQVYEYNIRVERHLIAIGICDTNFLDTQTFFYNESKNTTNFYTLLGWDGRLITYDASSSKKIYKKYADGLNLRNTEMNEVKLIYDASNATLSYKINGKDYGVACDTSKSSEISYRLAIHVDCRKDMIVELE